VVWVDTVEFRVQTMKAMLVARAAGLSIITFLTFSNAGCGKPAAQGGVPAPSPAVVTVETAERREVPAIAELAARIAAVATVEIRANVEGRLTEMSFKEGNTIQKGQVLFRIDPRQYEAAVQSAGAAVEKAEADLEMAREQQHLVNAQSALRQSRSQLIESRSGRRPDETAGRAPGGAPTGLDAAIAAQSLAAARWRTRAPRCEPPRLAIA